MGMPHKFGPTPVLKFKLAISTRALQLFKMSLSDIKFLKNIIGKKD